MSELLFEYKVRARHRLGWKEFSFYATTDIEEFLNRNSINYVRNMTDTVEHRQLKEIERLNKQIEEYQKALDEYLDLKRKSYIEGFKWSGLEIIDQTKDFLQELKGSE